MVRSEELRTHLKLFLSVTKNSQRDRIYKRNPNREDVFEAGMTAAWPFRGEPNSDKSCQLQLCTAIHSSVVTWGDISDILDMARNINQIKKKEVFDSIQKCC